jgi:hypothetical protein
VTVNVSSGLRRLVESDQKIGKKNTAAARIASIERTA